MQTDTVQTQLENAKSQIRTAISHADKAKANLEAFLKADSLQTKADAEAAMDHLKRSIESAKAALQA